MRRYHLLAALIALAALVAAGEESWEARTLAARTAAAAGDLALVEVELEAALDVATAFERGDPRLEATLETLGRLFEDQGRLDDSQPLYELLIAAAELRAGGDSPDLLDPLSAAGRVALRAGDVPSAAAHFRRYVEVADASGEADPKELWKVLSLLSRMGALESREEDALLFQRQAVAVLEQDPTVPPHDRATQLEGLARLELEHGSVAAAEALLGRAVELERQAGNPSAAVAVLSNAAAAALDAGQPDLAERLVERTLALEPGPEVALAARRALAEAAWQRVPHDVELKARLEHPADSPELARAAQRLADLAAVQRLSLPPGHPERSETLSRQVAVAASRGDLTAAEAAQQELVDGRRQADGPPLAAALADLVEIQLAAGKTAAATATNGGLIEVMGYTLGPADLRLRPVLERQLALLTQLGRKAEAKLVKKRLKG